MFKEIIAAIESVVILIGSFLGFTAVQVQLEPIPEVQSPVQQEQILGAATQPVAGLTYYLAGSGVSASASSITLTSFTIPQSGYELQDSDMSSTFYLTLEPGSRTRQEIVSCTTVTQNSGSSATLSGCSRGLLPFSPYTASSTYAFSHGGGTPVILSDAPNLYAEFAAKGNNETITGQWTFNTFPVTPDNTYASTTVAGITKLSVAPVSSSSPIAVGDNDTRVPTQAENDAIAGGGVFGTPSTTNMFLTEDYLDLSTSTFIFQEVDQSQTTQNATVEAGEADATTKKNKIAQSFVPTSSKIRGVSLYKIADTGTFTGTVSIGIQADSSGNPSGTYLASTTISNAVWAQIEVGEIQAKLSSEYTSLTVGSTYWIVIQTSTSDNSNHPNFGSNSAGGYTSGSVKYNNTSDGWTTIATVDMYFKTLYGKQSQLVKTDATDGIIPLTILPYGLVELDGTNSSNITNTAETTVYQANLPANFFTSNSGFRLSGSFGCTSTGGSAGDSQLTTVKVYLNGTAVGSLSTFDIDDSVTNTGGVCDWQAIVINDNSSSAQKYMMRLSGAGSGVYNIGGAGVIPIFTRSTDGTAAIAIAGANAVKVTLQNTIQGTGGAAGFTNYYTILEKVGK